jgi:hypothetical protein
MARVFISYRREDSGGYAGRIYDRLVERFGERQVFMDIDTIAPGDDFADVIDATLKACDVAVAVIGRNWIPTLRQRIADSHDWVRVELEIALARGIMVVPVLVGGGRLPTADELPEPMRPLLRRQAIEIREPGFNESVDRLVRAIQARSRRSMRSAFRNIYLRIKGLGVRRTALQRMLYALSVTLAVLVVAVAWQSRDLIRHSMWPMAKTGLIGHSSPVDGVAVKTKGRVLNRIEAESLLQKNRGSMELCIKNNPEILFLNFLFSSSEQAGINVDILAGREVRGTMLPHTRLPAGVYDYDTLSKTVAESHQEPIEPKQLGDEKLTYFVEGNTGKENPSNEHARITIAEIGGKLSTTLPAVNGCMIGVLNDSLSEYSGILDGKPFLHRYITDTGVAQSSVRPALLRNMNDYPVDEGLAQHLADVYEEGVDGPKDEQKAYQWLLTAQFLMEHGENKEVFSKENLEAVRRQLTAIRGKLSPDEVAAAKKAAEDWRREHTKR